MIVGRARDRVPAKDDDGASLVEYALLLALISVVAIGALTFLGGAVSNTLNNVGHQIAASGGAGGGGGGGGTSGPGCSPAFCISTSGTQSISAGGPGYALTLANLPAQGGFFTYNINVTSPTGNQAGCINVDNSGNVTSNNTYFQNGQQHSCAGSYTVTITVTDYHNGTQTGQATQNVTLTVS